MTDLILYKDKDLKHPYTIEDLGDVDAGDVKILDAYLFNSSVYEIIQIEKDILDEDIELIDVPEFLSTESWQLIKIKYTPKETRMKPLNTYITLRGKKRIPPE